MYIILGGKKSKTQEEGKGRKKGRAKGREKGRKREKKGGKKKGENGRGEIKGKGEG